MKHPTETTGQRRGSFTISACLAIAATVACLAPAQAAVTEDNFLARTTNDLVAVCGAEQTDPLYTAAVNFCQGFTIGSYQVLGEIIAANPKIRLFCVTEPVPSRNETVAAFVTWAQAHPEVGGKLPAEGVAAFLANRFPCPTASASRPAPVKKPAGGTKP